MYLDKELDEKFNCIEIKPISDVHLGDQQCSEELLMQDIEWVKEKPNRFTLLNGDILNCATIHSVSDSYASRMTPHEELKYARKLFEPIAGKVLGSVMGNHERRIYKDDGIDVSEELALTLGCAYSPEGMLLKVKFGKRKLNGKPQVYTVYFSHGFSSARMVGGKANRLEKLRKIILSDVYITSHTHQKITFNKTIIVPDLQNNKLTEKKQVFVNTGAYLNYGSYGEIKAYDPTELGSVVIKLYGEEKRIEVII